MRAEGRRRRKSRPTGAVDVAGDHRSAAATSSSRGVHFFNLRSSELIGGISFWGQTGPGIPFAQKEINIKYIPLMLKEERGK